MHCAAICITRDSWTAFENRNDRITRQPPKSLDNLFDNIYLDTKSIYFVLDILYTHTHKSARGAVCEYTYYQNQLSRKYFLVEKCLTQNWILVANIYLTNMLLNTCNNGCINLVYWSRLLPNNYKITINMIII